MSKEIDIIIQQGENDSGTPFVIPATFTVNLASEYVTATYAAGGTGIYDYFLSDARGYPIFSNTDHFLIVSLGISIPQMFDIRNTACKLSLEYQDGEGAQGLPIGNSGVFVVPATNYEIPIDKFLRQDDLSMIVPRLIGAKVTELDDTPLQISMGNVPAALDGKSFEIAVWMKIIHNISLVSY